MIWVILVNDFVDLRVYKLDWCYLIVILFYKRHLRAIFIINNLSEEDTEVRNNLSSKLRKRVEIWKVCFRSKWATVGRPKSHDTEWPIFIAKMERTYPTLKKRVICLRKKIKQYYIIKKMCQNINWFLGLFIIIFI